MVLESGPKKLFGLVLVECLNQIKLLVHFLTDKKHLVHYNKFIRVLNMSSLSPGKYFYQLRIYFYQLEHLNQIRLLVHA